MDTLVNHNTACFVVSAPVFDHVRALMNASVSIDLKVHNEEEHQALIVQEMLQAF